MTAIFKVVYRVPVRIVQVLTYEVSAYTVEEAIECAKHNMDLCPVKDETLYIEVDRADVQVVER